ncbi:MAG: peptigoglycan-binding protein LysM [Pseudomonadales bacterium RIFCSPLOWO2_12_59_9]|nr:MAG: peptigoglycan-binding protein LysM [Pseudomonadales bacterium RIFCSPLOWO2_12_59_9]
MLGLSGRRVVCSAAGHRALAWLGVSLVCAALSACNTTRTGGVQVVDRNTGAQSAGNSRQPVNVGQYIVQRGDTLYSIAFRFGWDWKTLAERNRIAAPYVIRKGQVIRFDGRTNQTPAVAQSSRPNTATTRVPPAVVRANDAAILASKPPPAAASMPASSTVAKNFAGRWTWPAKGALIGRFSSNGSLNKGIDLAGELGEPVSAASDGSVVYAGSGLRGYGELVIIKHSDTYVSAYGHNRRLLVREGQQVKVGQVIAEMGSTGTDRVKLHFEIRRQGKPVDPLQYLPKR